MLYFISLGAGIISAVIGWFATSIALATPLAHPSVQTLLGGAVGLVVGSALALRHVGGLRGIRAIATGSAIVVVLLVALIAAIASVRFALLDHLGLSAAGPSVEFEIRIPAQAAALDSAPRDMAKEVQVELRTDHNQAVARLSQQWQSLDDGQVVVSGNVPIAFKTTHRQVALNIPGQPTRLFKLRLAATPSHTDEFSPWIQVDAIDGDASPSERMRMTDGFAIRYRVL